MVKLWKEPIYVLVLTLNPIKILNHKPGLDYFWDKPNSSHLQYLLIEKPRIWSIRRQRLPQTRDEGRHVSKFKRSAALLHVLKVNMLINARCSTMDRTNRLSLGSMYDPAIKRTVTLWRCKVYQACSKPQSLRISWFLYCFSDVSCTFKAFWTRLLKLTD